MKLIVLITLILFVEVRIEGQIEENENSDSTTKESLVDFMMINDSNLKEGCCLLDNYSGRRLEINNSSLYQIKDSCIYTGSLFIWLTINLVNDKGINCYLYGALDGDLLRGKKDGKWILKDSDNNPTHILKQMNYKNGLLDGDYFVYNTDTKLFCDSIFSCNDSVYHYTTKGDILSENRVNGVVEPTSHFDNGTGLYLDYYNETGELKEKGFLRQGVRDGRWCFYDKQGNVIKVDIYHNGSCITR